MSATAAAAKQRLDNLHQQLESYRGRLRQQEEALHRLKTEMAQTRTVVEVTLPVEIRKAEREYTGTMSCFGSKGKTQHSSKSRGSWVRDVLGLHFDGTVVMAAFYFLFIRILKENWSQIMVFIVGLFVAGVLIPSHASNST